MKTAFEATRTTPGPYQIDFRILHPDGIRWVSARGRGADEGDRRPNSCSACFWTVRHARRPRRPARCWRAS
ncbi:hypothetical protein [Dankookia sp. P2]|uniref:hypothetical protein n=1 Tax=Dankookia sp. P2 TaxID=3423955 RepID=UPI003D66D6EA